MGLSPRHLGASHRGLGEWLAQRLTAVYMAGFGLLLLARLAWAPPADPGGWRDWFGAAPMRVAMVLFWWTALGHAWIGLRSVYLDYLKPLWLRLLAEALTLLGLAALALWALFLAWGAA